MHTTPTPKTCFASGPSGTHIVPQQAELWNVKAIRRPVDLTLDSTACTSITQNILSQFFVVGQKYTGLQSDGRTSDHNKHQRQSRKITFRPSVKSTIGMNNGRGSGSGSGVTSVTAGVQPFEAQN